MAKLYCKNGLVGGEELAHRVSLKEWMLAVSETDLYAKYFYDHLLQQGRYYEDSYSKYPKELIVPKEIRMYQCHANNCAYAEQLLEEGRDQLQDIRFVSGLFGMFAKTPEVPFWKKYFIGHHSFIAYKGRVVDMTMLEYPPEHYVVDQYFGIEFQIPDVVETYGKLKEAGADIGKGIPLEHLRIALTER